MSKNQRRIVVLATMVSMMLAVGINTNAMHIMEGYLPPAYCIAWGAISVPFIVAGLFSLNKKLKEDRKNITLIAMAGAFIFLISALKVPSLTGSCSHMTGTGLGAILFGVSSVSVLGLIVLVFQAILLAHGGLTTLGANTFSMAIAGPIVSWLIYKACQTCKINRYVGVFLAASIGELFTYCVTSVQLAMAYPAQNGVMTSVAKFLGVFAPTQLPLGILEGVLTVLIVMGLEKYAAMELGKIGFLKAESK